MKLKTVDGKLTLGSAYKLFVWGWILGWGAFMLPILFLLFVVAALTGQMGVNGEMVYGRGPAIMAMLPMLIMFPIIIVVQAFMVGGLVMFGLWLYRTRWPLTVTSG